MPRKTLRQDDMEGEEVHHEEEHHEEEEHDEEKDEQRGILRKLVTRRLIDVGFLADLFFVFYLTNDIDFDDDNMPRHERRTQYMNIAYTIYHGIRVISYFYMQLIDDMYARRQYFNSWWVTSPLFLTTSMLEYVFNTNTFIDCDVCIDDRKDWLWVYIPLVTVHIAFFLRVSYAYYEHLGDKYGMKNDLPKANDEHMEEENLDENKDELKAQFVTVKGQKIIRSKKY
mmetsp:Transcript_106712/g.147718  ORF Transcript_106712/g.147718 Transcript_106712/m.147718 type:complete len:227 (-) Transcript_106712:115-795(-)|eukprot:CAMPEP_0176372096 /NCGR_PEP_ID=MMETSP0126-20121128/25157_1 /TAXON_ID=141414 ORGANISM="Strombidinopsis acuminatum, Strain SPMC142" /NCGR_SAMPLE_ID=MMETSP0126 /ASSEMBLY_ACC=CAM_ASM_000229 /LENGTH=226 /DNA_ID=CAMNT_0017731813 /DNA_START=26 /DNA_END=707 /DNA_ORIENTATION=+